MAGDIIEQARKCDAFTSEDEIGKIASQLKALIGTETSTRFVAACYKISNLSGDKSLLEARVP